MQNATAPATPAQLLTVLEVAAVLKTSRGRTYELIASGELPSLLIGKRRRIRLRDLEAFVDAAEGIGPQLESA